MSKSTAQPHSEPEKPLDGFPLTVNGNGQWSKKLRGKVFYFGNRDDWEGALEEYQRDWPTILKTGRQPFDGVLTADRQSGRMLAIIRHLPATSAIRCANLSVLSKGVSVGSKVCGECESTTIAIQQSSTHGTTAHWLPSASKSSQEHLERIPIDSVVCQPLRHREAVWAAIQCDLLRILLILFHLFFVVYLLLFRHVLQALFHALLHFRFLLFRHFRCGLRRANFRAAATATKGQKQNADEGQSS